MNYDGIDAFYWQSQIERIENLRRKIASRALTTPGLLVPADDDLAIGFGRRLSVTVLFIDISGFSARPSSTAEEQEMMLRVLNLYFSEMIRIIEDYGGTVEKNTGDGLMAYFEDLSDIATNSTHRAVACSLTMAAANDNLLGPIYRASGTQPITHRVSIEHGVVTVARIGAPGRFNANVAVGNVANFAAKMLAHLIGGQIGLGHNAWGRLPEQWRTNFTALSDVSTGWTFGPGGAPYPLHLYTGRWARVT